MSDLPRSGFHGTKANVIGTLKDDTLTSASDRNTRPRYDFSDKTKTYFTPNESHAWTYANEGITLRNLKKTNRPVVFPVKASDEATVEKDKNMPAVGNLSLTSDKPLEITGEPEWGPPPSMYGGTVTAMALPHINWHQFGMPNWEVYRGESPLYDNDNFTSINAVMREAHPHLETRKVTNIIKRKRSRSTPTGSTSTTRVDPDQLELPLN